MLWILLILCVLASPALTEHAYKTETINGGFHELPINQTFAVLPNVTSQHDTQKLEEEVVDFIPAKSVLKEPKRYSLTKWLKIVTNVRPTNDLLEDMKSRSEDVRPSNPLYDYYDASRIINGTIPQRDEFPWQVRVYIDLKYGCGGGLVHPSWVLTAGHCVYQRKSFIVHLGAYNLTASSEPGRTYQITFFSVLHPEYDHLNQINDIALLKLSTPVQLSGFIDTIRLPRYSDVSKTFVGVSGIVSGWGRTANLGAQSDILRSVIVPVISNAACVNVYGEGVIVGSHLCAALIDNKTPCSGDSGGPMVYREEDGKFTVIGVAAFVSGTGCLGGPSGYTRVTSFLGWFSGVTGITLRS